VISTLLQEKSFMLKDIVQKSRSIRRFYQDTPVDMETLRELVDLARLSPSGSNLQALKYVLSNEPERNASIFNQLGWAGYLKDWPGPEEGERPAAYIIIVGDTTISKSFGCDHGIAAQSILLGAVEKGLGGCILGTVKRIELMADLHIPPQYEILLVLALGKPKEVVQVEPIGADGSVKYWRDEQQVHHVPKRALEEIIVQ
jgi:nitroreductase